MHPEFGSIPQSETRNLMQLSGGVDHRHAQWRLVPARPAKLGRCLNVSPAKPPIPEQLLHHTHCSQR
jgi:hypothetical protein